MLEWIFLGLCAVGWLGTGYLVYQKRSLYRWGFFLLMCVWLYISVVLVIFTFNPPLPVLLIIGLIPVIGVAYGYRLYDHYSEREKAKRKNEAEEPNSL